MLIKIFNEIDNKLFKDWENLWLNSNLSNFTNSPYWFTSCTENWKKQKYLIYAYYENDTLKGIVGLFKIKKYNKNILSTIPSHHTLGNPFLSVDNNSSNITKFLINEIIQKNDIFLENISEKELISFSIKKMSKTHASENYCLELNENILSKINQKQSKKLPQVTLDNINKFEIKNYSQNAIEMLPIAFTIDSNSYKNKNGYSTFKDIYTQNFYLSLAKNFQTNFCFDVLYYEGKPIGYQIGFITKDNFVGSQLSTDKQYKEFSTSRILLLKFINYLYKERNIKFFNFGSGADMLKKSITKEHQALYCIIISNNIITKKYIMLLINIRDLIYNLVKKYKKIYFIYKMLQNKLTK